MDFLHLYGLTESYGPITLCEVSTDHATERDGPTKVARLARQGQRHLTANRVQIVGQDGTELPWDGETTGEITLRGNTLMAGYLQDPAATEAAFQGGAFHTGEALLHKSVEGFIL